LGAQIKKNEISGVHDTYGNQKRVLGFGGETMGERDYLKGLGEDERIILKWIFK
jgi:hypothetical protein